MANEEVSVEELEKDALERAGIAKRDDLPITLEAAWGANLDGSPRMFKVGEPHPFLSGHLIFAIFQNPTELKVYSLCPQANGAAPQDPKAALRANPTRTTLVKTSRCYMVEVMILDVFVESIAQDFIMLEIDTYGPPPDGPEEKGPAKDAPKPQPTAVPAGS